MMWVYKNKTFTEQQIGDNVGFIYLITNLTNNKKYVGQKVFYNKVSKKPLKGKTKRRISKKFSNWTEYYGSNDELKLLVEQIGGENFKREIIRLCKSKSEMNYWESYEIFARHAIVSDDYYNNWISCRINKNQLSKVKFDEVKSNH